MPEKRREGVYSIRELPEEVRKKVLERWRYEIWDDHDSQNLTELFKEELQRVGFLDPDVGWSLSYCQGDGVCFWGGLDLEAFFKWVFSGDSDAKPYAKEAKKFVILQDLVSVRILHENHRYCHWNSMDVEIEVTGSEYALIPEKYRDEVRDAFDKRRYAVEDWVRAKGEVDLRRLAPIVEWQQRMKERSRLMNRGPKEWRPGIGPEPAPLDIPYPPEPVVHVPAAYVRMMEKAKLVFDGIDPLIAEFQTFLEEWVEQTSRELEKIGYAEIEYRQSNEAIIEFLEGNDYEFDEDGEEI